MEIINGSSLSDLCDYSFGDHMGAASIPRPEGGFMKEANDGNKEFIEACRAFEGRIMTLFIDNIRLYRRGIWTNEGNDADWIKYLLARNDLLELCKSLPQNKFVIFCSHEDTPIDKYINIPDNVLGIYAVNAEYYHEKVFPFPYGLQRKLNREGETDNRLQVMKEEVELDRHIKPNKLLYINCGLGLERNNPERASLVNFEGYNWVTTRFHKDSKPFPYAQYKDYLNELRDHKFVVCPLGHGLDCHRNWETLYMRRVPVMKDHQYMRRLMQGFPVLWVHDWSDINYKMLWDYEYLYKQAQEMNLNKLDLHKMFAFIMNSYVV